MFSFIFSILTISGLNVLKFYKKYFKKKKKLEFTRKNFYKWMSLTKKERFNLSKSESNSYRNKRKDLLEKIRKEYEVLKK